MFVGINVLIVVAAFVLALIIGNVRIVAQSDAYVLERLGSYNSTWSTGVHVKMPFLDRIASRVSLKEQVADFAPQPVITKDNVTMMIDTVIYLQITDPKLYTYGVVNPLGAIENLTNTTLRNIIGELELDDTLTSRDMINNRMRMVLDDATDSWGIKVNRVEVRNIAPPKSIQEAMEKQMRAERERRESILKAEGEKQSAILVAEGQKASAILKAEAEKAAVILQAEAAREAAIREAEGEAQAILNVQRATAEGLSMIKAVCADEALIKLKSLEALQKVADGQATKLIIPSDIQNLAGLVTSVTELARK
ncbi:MAG: SPFH/Band 7/PHB domain protein [Treponema sp.]|jgi:regulator of protease activity HflC (stomatin/prohibitin superfamily)|nr:SPFH/Band 7/PHB domain protein [Treponema sp.]